MESNLKKNYNYNLNTKFRYANLFAKFYLFYNIVELKGYILLKMSSYEHLFS